MNVAWIRYSKHFWIAFQKSNIRNVFNLECVKNDIFETNFWSIALRESNIRNIFDLECVQDDIFETIERSE